MEAFSYSLDDNCVLRFEILMLLVVLKNVLCVVADGLSKNVDFFIVRKKYFHHEEKVFSP